MKSIYNSTNNPMSTMTHKLSSIVTKFERGAGAVFFQNLIERTCYICIVHNRSEYLDYRMKVSKNIGTHKKRIEPLSFFYLKRCVVSSYSSQNYHSCDRVYVRLCDIQNFLPSRYTSRYGKSIAIRESIHDTHVQYAHCHWWQSACIYSNCMPPLVGQWGHAVGIYRMYRLHTHFCTFGANLYA